MRESGKRSSRWDGCYADFQLLSLKVSPARGVIAALGQSHASKTYEIASDDK